MGTSTSEDELVDGWIEGVVADGIGGIVFFLASGLTLCLLVWDNVEPLAAVADVRAGSEALSATDVAVAGDGHSPALWKRFSFSARAVVSCGVGGSRPKRAC